MFRRSIQSKTAKLSITKFAAADLEYFTCKVTLDDQELTTGHITLPLQSKPQIAVLARWQSAPVVCQRSGECADHRADQHPGSAAAEPPDQVRDQRPDQGVGHLLPVVPDEKPTTTKMQSGKVVFDALP